MSHCDPMSFLSLEVCTLQYTLALEITAAISMCLFLSDNQFNLGKKLSYNTAVSNSNGALANIFTLIQMSFVLLAVIGDCWVQSIAPSAGKLKINLFKLQNWPCIAKILSIVLL
jgi:hypothetical protein